MAQIPQDSGFDNTLSLASDGYQFVRNRQRELQSDIFETRLMLRKVICISGEEASKLFYDEELFERKGVTPGRVNRTLLGEGGVQGLDDEAHRWRKQMFMSMMTPARLRDMKNAMSRHWDDAAIKWETMRDDIVLLDEAEKVIARAVFEWTGVPLEEADVEERTADIAAMIEGAGAVGRDHWRGRSARDRTEKWISDIIEDVRKKKRQVPEGTALYIIANHRDLKGRLMDKGHAAVDLLNILRPTVAIGRFIVFAALALHEHPEIRRKLETAGDDEIEHFVQEVRRYYPFFPFQMARVRKEFQWRGFTFPKGRKVMLDLHGTNRDPRSWKDPDEFRPERFQEWDESAYSLIPQGGGDHYRNHRCPGEWITIDLMKVAVRKLVSEMEYDIPEQDLEIDMTQMPTAPSSRFIIQNVRTSNLRLAPQH
ncbi:MAG: cytochrome P450 [Sphaerobacteraceae bacterium]|nr:MAG: cytochrome P450 [Sphaerobacteraceae bacterium]